MVCLKTDADRLLGVVGVRGRLEWRMLACPSSSPLAFIHSKERTLMMMVSPRGDKMKKVDNAPSAMLALPLPSRGLLALPCLAGFLAGGGCECDWGTWACCDCVIGLDDERESSHHV